MENVITYSDEGWTERVNRLVWSIKYNKPIETDTNPHELIAARILYRIAEDDTIPPPAK